MISPRPLKVDRRLVERYDSEVYVNGIIDAYGAFYECDSLDEDDLNHIVACVNAFSECGIEPADLPKFVEAVRRTMEAQAYTIRKKSGADAVAHEAFLKMQAAAACLPENRGTNGS